MPRPPPACSSKGAAATTTSCRHRRSCIGARLVDRIGLWRDPRVLQLPTDCEFFQRVRAASAIVPSNDVTVFKCNAAARRNAYQSKSVDEQRALLAGLARGDRFIGEELVKVLASLHAGRSTRIRMPDPASVRAGEIFRANRIAKGVEPRFGAEQLRSLDADETFRLDQEATGYEWHAVEQHPHFGSFRWTGPARRSTIELPVRLDRPLAMRIHVPWVIGGQSIDDIAVDAQGAAVDVTVERAEKDGWILSGVIDPARHASCVPYVQITLERHHCGAACGPRHQSGPAPPRHRREPRRARTRSFTAVRLNSAWPVPCARWPPHPTKRGKGDHYEAREMGLRDDVGLQHRLRDKHNQHGRPVGSRKRKRLGTVYSTARRETEHQTLGPMPQDTYGVRIGRTCRHFRGRGRL